MSEFTVRDAVETERLLDAICMCSLEKCIKFYISTFEIYNRAVKIPQDEEKTILSTFSILKDGKILIHNTEY